MAASSGLVYASVSRDGVVLVDFSPHQGNFAEVAAECLRHLQPGQSKLTIVCDKHTFNIVRRDSFVFLAVAEEAFGRAVPFAFLDRISEDFEASVASKARAGGLHSLDRAFGAKLKQHMDYCSHHPDELTRVAGVQKKVDEVRGIMVQNIEKVIERGERIELLVDKTDQLRVHAQAFQKHGRQLRTSMWWQSLRMKIIVAVVVLLLAVVIFLLACFAGGRSCVAKHAAAAAPAPAPQSGQQHGA